MFAYAGDADQRVDHHRAGLGNMGEFLTDEQRGQPGYEGFLNDRVETLASRLKRVGYRTGMAGKWHLGDAPGQRPFARGFDQTFALMEGSGSAWSDRSPAPIIGERTQFMRNGEPVERPEGFSATLYVDEIIDFIEGGDRAQPFFGYLAFQAVHWPHHAPQHYRDEVRGRYAAGWRAIRDARFARQRALGLFGEEIRPAPLGEDVPDWQSLPSEARADEAARMEAYAAMTIAMDAEIGRLIAFLSASGRLEDTLVIFVSDNGADPSEPERNPAARPWYDDRYPDREPEHLGRPGTFPSTGLAWARVSSTPLAFHKGQPGEGGLRVPFIAYYPKRIAPGKTSAAFGYVTDIVPTVLDAAGVSASGQAVGARGEQFDGESLWPVLLGSSETLGERAVGYELMGHSALFKNELKLVRQHQGPWKLYDLTRDPGETEDLGVARPQDLQTMRQAYDTYEASVGVVPVPADFDVMKLLLRARESSAPKILKASEFPENGSE